MPLGFAAVSTPTPTPIHKALVNANANAAVQDDWLTHNVGNNTAT